MLTEMPEYYVLDSDHCSYRAIVLSLSSKSLSDELNEIANSLYKKNISGKILLDYYHSNGNTTKRFFEIRFNGVHFELNSLKSTKVSRNIAKKIENFYHGNRALIHDSVISATQF